MNVMARSCQDLSKISMEVNTGYHAETGFETHWHFRTNSAVIFLQISMILASLIPLDIADFLILQRARIGPI